MLHMNILSAPVVNLPYVTELHQDSYNSYDSQVKYAHNLIGMYAHDL